MEVFYAPYINFHSFIYSRTGRHKINSLCKRPKKPMINYSVLSYAVVANASNDDDEPLILSLKTVHCNVLPSFLLLHFS